MPQIASPSSRSASRGSYNFNALKDRGDWVAATSLDAYSGRLSFLRFSLDGGVSRSEAGQPTDNWIGSAFDGGVFATSLSGCQVLRCSATADCSIAYEDPTSVECWLVAFDPPVVADDKAYWYFDGGLFAPKIPDQNVYGWHGSDQSRPMAARPIDGGFEFLLVTRSEPFVIERLFDQPSPEYTFFHAVGDRLGLMVWPTDEDSTKFESLRAIAHMNAEYVCLPAP